MTTLPQPASASPLSLKMRSYRFARLRRLLGRCVEIVRYALVRPTTMHEFFVVSPAWRAGDAAVRCLESVWGQRYPRELVHHLYIDDASDDDTPSLIRDWLQRQPRPNVEFVQNTTRQGMLANNLRGFLSAPPHSVVLEVDGDDWLPDPGVLPFLNKVYADPEVWMTYNTLARHPDGKLLRPLGPPRRVVRDNAFRDWEWMTSHLHSFRAPLVRHVPAACLTDPTTGTYFDMAQDVAFGLAMLELAGHHAWHVYRITYTYNLRELSEESLDRARQIAVEGRIRATSRCEPLTRLDHPSSARDPRGSRP